MGSNENCPDPALSWLPRPSRAPRPAVGGPSNADPGLLPCSRQNRLLEYRSPVSPSRWPFSMTSAPLRASGWAGEGACPPAPVGSPCRAPCPSHGAQSQHPHTGPHGGARKSPLVFGHQDPCSAPGGEMGLCRGSAPPSRCRGLAEGGPSWAGGAPAAPHLAERGASRAPGSTAVAWAQSRAAAG